MGCSYSKRIRKVSLCSVTPKQQNIEPVVALPQPATPPPTDDRLPLNARQVFLLKKSWKGIHRNMQATGVEMFLRLVAEKYNVQFYILIVQIIDLSRCKCAFQLINIRVNGFRPSIVINRRLCSTLRSEV